MNNDASKFNIQVATGIPDCAKQLIWETFYLKRARGVAWHQHLPWAAHHKTKSAIATRSKNSQNEVAAVAVMRPHVFAGENVIGYVCVAQGYRGQGLVSKLIAELKDQARDQGVDRLVLWTSLPRVYISAGFHISRQYRNVAIAPFSKKAGRNIEAHKWDSRLNHDMIGMPPFSTATWRLTYKNSKEYVIIADAPNGCVMLDAFGQAEAISDILMEHCQNIWNASLDVGDSLYQYWSIKNMISSDKAGPIEMRISSDTSLGAEIATCPTPILYRI